MKAFLDPNATPVEKAVQFIELKYVHGLKRTPTDEDIEEVLTGLKAKTEENKKRVKEELGL
ncbi:hypothetical protein F7230_02950 [Corynebacterium sp. 320]|uniref:hypothetical protein n=1 Tax=Corynebacterium TaxID=1716 RepID=UPI00125CB52D|nr:MULTISPECIES: hypothetical protein [Corynebacterium]KAB1504068.1 hypothetical protein F7230_02950 [Corynebacterium sp. 320]KAB1552833.1 hypothetical protein F7233_03645 [Corynebacterium sp. 321]KAB1553949.1 hypothetical protein F7232_02940 [Corynebacterium sp. 319]KAB3528204.1 hypothetical protein F8354_02950 [Corynebacterium sp. 250]KAB3540308.1 hypothetical protein F8390_03390 [Corynebacterium sp. 366]